jgi:hypothetical protein
MNAISKDLAAPTIIGVPFDIVIERVDFGNHFFPVNKDPT